MAPSSPRRRLERAVRRNEIVEAATALIAARGYRGLTLAQFADSCGMTVAGMLHHFASREELLVAVLDNRDRVDAAVTGFPRDLHASPLEARAALDAIVAHNIEQRGIISLYTILGAESLDPSHPASEYFAARLAESVSIVASLVSSWHPNPESFAIQTIAFMDGLQLNWLRDPSIDFAGEWARFADRIFVEVS